MTSQAHLDTSKLGEQVREVYGRYSAVLSDDQIEEWPRFFTATCRYEVISRLNFERRLPLATMRYHSRGALNDRVTAVRNTLVFEDRAIAHLVGSVVVTEMSATVIKARSALAVYHTLSSGESCILLVGRSFDELHNDEDGAMRFHRRTVVYDNDRLSGSLVYPV